MKSIYADNDIHRAPSARAGSPDSRRRTGPEIPRHVIIAGLVMLVFAIVASGFSFQTGIGRTSEPATPTSSRFLSFEAREGNTLAVLDTATGRELEVLPSADEGFIAGAIRSLQYERRRHSKPADAPFRLIGTGTQGLALIDPSTGIYLQLEAYGFENARTMARFLPGAHPSDAGRSMPDLTRR